MSVIREMRERAGLSLREFEKLTGIPFSTVNAWENGRPTLSWLPPMIEHYVEYRLNGGEAVRPPKGNYMRALVGETEMTQVAFARATGIPKRTVQNWQLGDSEPFSWVYPILHEWLRHNDLLKREHTTQ